MTNSINRFRPKQSPPKLSTKATPAHTQDQIALGADAQVQEKRGVGWGKMALGLGLAATALTGCGKAQPPAANPGSYEIESVEIVVLSDSVQRVDISREQERECSGFGEDRDCDWEDVDYHPVGIHVGEGVVQDLNGNLFAAPQLVSPGAPGIAISNPDSVKIDGPLGLNGTLTREDDNTYETRGLLFGRSEITIDDHSATVREDVIFGDYESMSVSNDNGVTTIKEGRHVEALVQSQGTHVLVQTKHGRELGEIRHEDGSQRYEISSPGLFGDFNTSVSYSENEVQIADNGWTGPTISKSTNNDGQQEFKVKHGPIKTLTTTVSENGWKDDHIGPGSFTYTTSGGEFQPTA